MLPWPSPRMLPHPGTEQLFCIAGGSLPAELQGLARNESELGAPRWAHTGDIRARSGAVGLPCSLWGCVTPWSQPTGAPLPKGGGPVSPAVSGPGLCGPGLAESCWVQQDEAWAGLELSSVSASHHSQHPLGPPHSGWAARPRTNHPVLLGPRSRLLLSEPLPLWSSGCGSRAA